MLPVYSGSEAIETVYTYDEWLKEYKRRESMRKIRQRAENLYYMKQRFTGAVIAVIGIASPHLLEGDATISLFIIPLGVMLMLTREKVIKF